MSTVKPPNRQACDSLTLLTNPSTGPPGPVRIATSFTLLLQLPTFGQHRPSGAGEDRNLRRRDVDLQRHRPSTGPPGPVRIATARVPAPQRGRVDQHRPSGAGEDRNVGTAA